MRIRILFYLLFLCLLSENVRAESPNLQLQSITSTRLTNPHFCDQCK
jgi:hypothetical protein